MITARSLLLGFSLVSHTLLLIYWEGNNALYTGYLTSAQEKIPFSYCQHPAHLPQGLNGTGVKQTRQPPANLMANVNLSGPMAALSLPLFLYSILFCVNFLRTKTFYCMSSAQLSKSGNLILIQCYYLTHSQISPLIPGMNVLYGFLSHDISLPCLTSFNLDVSLYLCWSFIFEDYKSIL